MSLLFKNTSTGSCPVLVPGDKVTVCSESGTGCVYTGTTGRFGEWAGVNISEAISNSTEGNYNPNNDWMIMHTNAGGESALIALNGDTIVMSSPSDDGAIIYLDEDDLEVDFIIESDGTIITTSDERVKENINPLKFDNILDKMSEIQPISFTFKRPESVTRETKKYEKVHRGFSAQNVQSQFPDFVKTNKDGKLAVNLMSMNLALIEAVKELTARVKKLEGSC